MRKRDAHRTCWTTENWPEHDRVAWTAINAPAHFLDAPTGPSRWRDPTRRKHRAAWGRYLSWMGSVGALGPVNSPAERITPSHVERYIELLRSQVASRTVFGYVVTLVVLGRLFDPERDWTWLKKVVNRLQQASRPLRNVKFCSSIELFAAGLKLIQLAECRPPRLALDQSSWFRDGLMVALLASRPIRAKNLRSVEIGKHLTWRDDRYWLSFPGDEMKNGRPLEFPLPAKLTQPMRRYLDAHRPKLLQGSKAKQLWISNLGRPMHSTSIADRIKTTTAKMVGLPLNPHAFRHAAATTIAELDPENARIIRAILSHSSLDFSNRVYNKASNAIAAAHFAEHVCRERREQRS